MNPCCYNLCYKGTELYFFFYFQCKLHETNPSLFAGVDKSVYQLIDKNVNPVNGEPIFYQHGVQFLKLVVDHDGGNGSNIYIATGKCLYGS